ncbi:hypothetical protein [Chitinophaga tropicalis]|uniref:Uncharacterized protein n=1 Tax=Chitinophaga tropicalis TaxID=2683588 RepID=A0A7K1U559_9BACT|nr:hypothetical protein [Chitinophaga tropicalis]MVT09502.1 hypothetical protein [Chitinophaga tropicalis]
MKPISSLVLSSIFLVLLISSCRKEATKQETNQTNSEKLKEVIAWLDIQDQKFANLPIIRHTISELRENIVGSQLSTEVLNDKQSLIIIPLKSEYKAINFTSDQSFKNLVIIESDHQLMLSNIIEIIPKDQHYDKVPANLISKIYNNSENELNGTFSFLSLANTLVESREYKNGKLFFINKPSESKKKSAGSNARIEDDPTTVEGYYGEEWDSYSSISDPDPTFDSDLSGAYYVPIKYHYNAQVIRVKDTREIINVVVDPITAEPMQATYTDRYGRIVTRYLTLFDHFTSFALLNSITVEINWSCAIYAQYGFIGGPWSRQWYKNFSAIR